MIRRPTRSTRTDPLFPYTTLFRSSLLIGVNNQYRGRAVEEYRGEFARLLERAIGYAGGLASRVLVLSIPDWGVTPFAAREGRDGAPVARALDRSEERRVGNESGSTCKSRWSQ